MGKAGGLQKGQIKNKKDGAAKASPAKGKRIDELAKDVKKSSPNAEPASKAKKPAPASGKKEKTKAPSSESDDNSPASPMKATASSIVTTPVKGPGSKAEPIDLDEDSTPSPPLPPTPTEQQPSS